jgi:Tol biopolymer transport system component
MFANETKNPSKYYSAIKRLAPWKSFLILILFIGIPTIVGHRLSSATRKGDSISGEQNALSNTTSTMLGANLESPQAGSTQVSINFDELAPFTDVSSRYPFIRFSSSGLSVYSWPAPAPRSSPNSITRGIILGFNNVENHHFADLLIDFTQPVNNLRFYITGGDNFGTVALMDYYQNGTLAQSNLAIGGPGPSHTPIPIDFQSSNTTNITRVKIHNITDNLGLTFDDFSFTVPAPTPTPTPTPTPPQTPMNLKGVPDENSARLTWSPSAGADRYVVTRSGDNCSDDSSIASTLQEANIESSETVGTNVVVPGGSTTLVDSHLCANHTYTYFIAAVGANGLVSPNSEPVSVKPLPKPGCDGTFKNPPIAIGSFNATGGYGWIMNYRFSSDSGMELNNISLYGRLMAEWISTPYFVIAAHNASGSGQGYGQLWANGSNPDGSLHSTLTDFKVNPPEGSRLLLEATYKVDHIPGAPRSCLTITQDYEFYAPGAGVPPKLGPPSSGAGPCEPSGTVPCAKFRPMVSYQFHDADGEFLDMINIPQRHHYQVKGAPDNTVGVFQDNDTYGQLLRYRAILGEKRNPVVREFSSTVVGPTTAPNSSAGYRDVRFDNYHQTNNKKVDEPTALGPGCPECFHDHWRWGALVPNAPSWGNGSPLIPSSSSQSLDIGVVRFPGKVGPQQQWTSLVQGNPLRRAYYYTCPVCIKPLLGETGVDPVFWFSPISHTYSDTFFYHTAWFNPHSPNTPSGSVNIESSGSSSPTSADGPVTVIFGDVYQTGTTTFDSHDLSTLPPVPAGFAALGNTGYSIATTAVVSGPHAVNFSAASVNDQNVFNNLRIFHLEVDPFDPDNFIWVDATVDSPDTPLRDFSSKTLSAKSMDLGIFTIGSLVQSLPPSTDIADIVVTTNASSNPVTAGNQLIYTLQVTNNGPQVAHKVAIRNGLSTDVQFESAASAHGSCKELDGTVFCSLNSLNVGETATVSIIVTPTEGTSSFPTEGKNIYDGVLAKAEEADSNIDNNSATETTLVLPNPNKAPTVSITSPQTGALIVGPTNIAVTMMATDSDGSISKVEVFDKGELIGEATPTGNNQYLISEQNASFGNHSLIAVATDNGGRQNLSNAAVVIINGPANVGVTSPSAGALFAPTSNVVVTASASNPSGIINRVEFFANGESIGQGGLVSGSQYSVAWNNLNNGIYALVAVATDGSGITTTSAPVTVTVDSPPTVTMTGPGDGSVFPSLTNINVSAIADSAHASIARVDFYGNGILVGSASDVGTARFTATWRHLADGLYSLTAVATDSLGVSTSSAAITIGVNTATPRAGEFIWFDDAPPAGAAMPTDDEGWYWVDANPAAFSGVKAHQSKNLEQVNPSSGIHKHSFDGAATTLPVSVGDRLFTYVFLDINNMPREIMLEWKDEGGWEHRAYWGENNINLGTNGTNSRRYMGLIPRSGQWARLEVPASLVGLEGSTLNGMAFTLDGGRATWDSTGKAIASAAPPPTTLPGDSVWIEDDFPAGPINTSDTVNDQWTWVANPRFSGQRAHQSQVTADHNTLTYRSHAFKGAQTPMQVNSGDVLFTYVLIDPSAKPDQIMLQWYDGSSWEHRAFWGENFINQLSGGVQGTESQRYMGGVPEAGKWYRLEVPASYVGLEGKSVTGMAFTIYGKEPTVIWDRSGKVGYSNNIFLPLSPTAAVWSLRFKTFYAYDVSTRAVPNYDAEVVAFYAHPNQAAGTVPFYRFHDFKGKFYYSTCRTCAEQAGWTRDGVAFYVYTDGSTPGAVPLYEFHGSETFYYSVTPTAPAGMSSDGIVAYVHPNSGLVPRPPGFPQWDGGCLITWLDNSKDETGFEIRTDGGTWPLTTVPVGTVGPDVTSFNICPLTPTVYTVRAHNSFGSSEGVSTCTQCAFSGPPAPANNPSSVSIVAPSTGDVVDHDFPITANAFDSDGNGTIAKVEFFANGSKLGEVAEPPYIFSGANIAPGSYSLTAISTDSAGVTTTSSPVNVTVAKLDQTITFDSIPDKSYGDAPFAVSATASSSLPVTFSIVSGPATISGNTITVTGVGNVTVHASQAGDASNNAAPDVDLSFNVAKASARITLNSLSQTYDGRAKPVTATTNPAGLTGVSITYNGSATTPTNAGSYSIVASLANDNYTAADATCTLTIGKASETITFNPLTNKTYGDASFAVTASCSSGLGVSFSIVSGPATIAGSTVTLNGAGTVTVRASQSGNENYNTATNVDQSFSVAKASATITLTNLNQNYDGTPKPVTATTNPSGLSGVSVKYNGSSTAPSNAGSYSVVASLTNDNYTATDATGTLIINAPPTVSITSPTNGALLHATSVTISASASDSDGSVSKVEFFQGSVKLGQVVSAPFNFLWNNVAGGSYSLTAVATDNSGGSTVSSPVSITVNNPPNVNVTASSPQDIPTAPAQITINADASDADGTISKVEFYQGTTLLATDLTSPYSYTWSNVAAGNYSITAKATDNAGAVTTSNVVGFTVNAKPNVSLTSPGSGASFIAPGLVSLNATASDSDGSISKVEFYQGSTLISTVTAGPYSFNWSYVPAGTYILTAKATDNVGAATTSNSVTITVTANSVAIGKIAFASNRDGCAQIYLMNTDGTGQTCLSNGQSNDESPKWSPNNSRIVFQSDRDFQNAGDNPIYGMDIYVMNWDGSGVSRLTSSASDDIAPVWSPDGTKIAFQSFRNGLNYQIYVMNADGSGQVNVSNSTAHDIEPSWSPDGTKIAFASDRDQPGFSSIYVMNANGSNQTRLTSSGSGFLDEQPAWSPDGTKLAFTTTRDSTVVTWDEWDSLGNLVVKTKLLINKEVYVMNADGSSQVRLTNIMGNDDSPVWSPDGTKIVFRSDRDRNCCDPVAQIWIMNADGSSQINVSNNSFGDYCPSWSR